ncbi:DNA cytosine methyltransferase [Aurantiacibacter sp. MUD11]|uniref:DNA cytosine methyltransferase n=1 Tax=Aurantiacibacter sp. MUD11 TaxID=3003265 RepID=UPI0022AA038A|nr:DNA cytosine methyltransferase [Aurantiacibacter sp. MUD11]WAT19258.1 DNA cytosine methyltransferase [Aurantiacibacter sp. MUD11]
MIDLFAGCGGLSLGMENAGFTPVFVNELNEHAMETYLANRHHEVGGKLFRDQDHLRCNDAHELEGERLEKLVRDLSEVGITFPTKEEADAGNGGSSLELLAGGPPCQGYSGIGHRRSYSVDKKDIPSNQLYQRMSAIIRRVRPKVFLFENVRGLLSAKWTKEGGRKIWPDVLDEFRSIPGYEVRWSLVRAGDYGVPQNRPRVLLVGIRDDLVEGNSVIDIAADEEDAVACGFLPKGEPSDCPGLEELLGDLEDPRVKDVLKSGDYPKGKFETTEYPSPPATEMQRRMRAPATGSASNVPVTLTDHEYSKHGMKIVEKFSYMIRNNGEIPDWAKTKKFAQRVLPRTWGNRGPSITATSLPDDYVHFSQPRSLTVREWARLQLFPDWYVFKGKRTTGGIRRAGNPREGVFDREVPKYTQIGNAVPVGLAERVGNHFRKVLEDAEARVDEKKAEAA